MCGRTACTLDPDTLQKACTYFDPNTNKFQQYPWKDHPKPASQDPKTPGCTYYPSANQCPTNFTPVMFREPEGNKIIQPMMWGMIPRWHTGNPKSHGISTNNCRLEGILSSKMYKPALTQRRLCVAVAQGFYEWKTVGVQGKSTKQPYFIFMPQTSVEVKNKIYDEEIWKAGTWNEEEGWNGPKVLMMAGLYDIWKSPEGDNYYSYTVITMEANETMSWLHDRMPAILETPEQVEAWLNPAASTTTEDLLAILKPATKLESYIVDTKVNNSRCKDKDCMIPLSEKKPEGMMANWLQKGTKNKADEEPSNSQAKKPKLELPEKTEEEK